MSNEWHRISEAIETLSHDLLHLTRNLECDDYLPVSSVQSAVISKSVSSQFAISFELCSPVLILKTVIGSVTSV
jgi:hypothetical protein